MDDAPKSQDVNQAVALSDEDRDVFYTALMEYAYNDSHSIRQQDCAAALADRADYMQIVATEHQATALRGEPEAAGHGSVEGDVRALRQMVADCDVYLKEGETPAQRIDRERRDTEAVLNLLIREKQRTEAMREVMLRMMAGIDHLAEIARQWEPDYSSGADRRGWVLAKDARDDAARLIPETHQAASGCSHTAPSDGQNGGEQGATPPAPAAPLGERDQWDFGAWLDRLMALADNYYETGSTSQARARVRAALLAHARQCATGWRARSALAASPQPAATSE